MKLAKNTRFHGLVGLPRKVQVQANNIGRKGLGVDD
jgi:hypothetical protein